MYNVTNKIKEVYMNRTIKMLSKTMIALSVSSLAMVATAQQNAVSVKENAFIERVKLTKEYPLSNAITIGWYTGAIDSNKDGLSSASLKLLPLSNFITTQLGRLSVLDIDFTDASVANQASLGNVDVVYTSALISSQLLDLGWKPLVNRNLNLSGVILMKKSIKVEKPEDLKGKRLIANLTSTVNYMTTYGLSKVGVSTEVGGVKIVDNAGSQYDVSKIVNDPNVDGAIIRKEVANAIIKKNPENFYIAYEAPVAPGHTVMVSPNLKPEEVKKLKDALLGLNADNPTDRVILEGLDGYTVEDKKPFKEIKEEDISAMKDIYSLLKIKPLQKK